MTNFFFYGTLMDTDILSWLLGRPVKSNELVSASLRGYSRYFAQGYDFPGLEPNPNGVVDGKLMKNVLPFEAWLLDVYEGPSYQHKILPVALSDGTMVDASVYLSLPEHLPLSNVPWDYKKWAVKFKQKRLSVMQGNEEF